LRIRGAESLRAGADGRAAKAGCRDAGRVKPLRVVSWNVENLAPWLRAETPLLERLHALGDPDVLCLQETRVRPQDEALVDAMQRALPGYDCHASMNRDRHNGAFRGGRAYGVATWVRAPESAVRLAYPWDVEGRVVVTGLPARGLAVANVYAVNGTARPHRDPRTGAVHGDRHRFKQAFIERLGRDLAALQRQGLRLVAIGDWNVSRTALDTTPRLRKEEPHATARRRFNEEFVAGLDLVDVFRERHPGRRAHTWFNPRARGGRLDAARVDFALVSRALAPAVLDAGIDESPAARPGSDHAPIHLVVQA
jgi:exodeoxyribonuclease-3